MLLAMAKDVRVILVKLADRLHNMRTLGGVTPEKGRRVARETLEIYAPIADRLGLNTLVREFHNLCLAAAHPFRYQVLEKAMMAAKGNRREVLTKILDTVVSSLTAQGIEAEVNGREKSLYSVHRKMVEQKEKFCGSPGFAWF
ncbi:Bifunctional (p)ppGpp synthase/hydrolase SpoT [Oligella urethralis]|uniref:Bifunctional (P)ppGpp synthase/hydrolase SpoT n=1 Tax=Oligella urethralis TaxID=90245 RepID=A0A2X1WKF2_9BURK|nr:Bifunctional (p)ppGpp synthase/hydrolase SpoT [Oligella urethralis]